MSIKKFIISSGDGELEESELDYSGNRTIGYNNITQKIEISNADIINNLTVSGSMQVNGSIQDVSQITSSHVLISNNLTVHGTASVAFLETIQQQNLLIGDKYITILSGANDHTSLDGAGILWGSGSTDGTTGDQDSVAYVLYRGIGTNTDYIQIFPGLRVSGSLSSSNGITGSFSGDGSGLTGIPSSAVILSDYATLTGVSGTFATLSGITASYASKQEVTGALEDFLNTGIYNTFAELDGGNSFTGSQFVDGLVSASSGFTGSFNGDGTYIINLSGSNWGPAHSFQTDVRNQLSGGVNLNYTTGTFALKDVIKLSSVTASFSGSGLNLFNLTGSGWGPNNNFAEDVWNQLTASTNLTYQTGTYRLNDNIQLNGVSASFSGSGIEIYDITSSNIQNFTKDVHEKFVAESNLTYTTSSLSASYKLNDNIQLNSVTASFSGNASNLLNANPKIVFTTTDDSGITVGHIVALTGSGLRRSEKSNDMLSNALGVVCYKDENEVHVQTSGEIALTNIVGTNVTTGSVIYVGISGHGCTYDFVGSGEYATQIGYVTGNGDFKIAIQPRVFGQLA